MHNLKRPTASSNKLINFWQRLRSSFWLLPAVMTTTAVLLAFGLIALDGVVSDKLLTPLVLLYTGGAEGTRGLLSSIATSMIGVAGTVFSITIAVLTLASTNYGPRLLRNFMRDRGNQVVLGTFVATFLYSLIVLRSVRTNDGDSDRFVPHIATTVAILLAIASIAVLIYFIHHITLSLQPSTIVAGLRRDLEKTIERIFPGRIGLDASEHETHKGRHDLPHQFKQASCPIKATKSGYIQSIDNTTLLVIATSKDIVIRIPYRPGDYVVQESDLALIWPGDRVTDELTKQINKVFTLGQQRTTTEDIEFGIFQIVEVAMRALSPSLNDPFTPVICLDQLSVVLSRLAKHDFPSRYRYDDQHHLRVIAESITFEQLVDTAFNQIRQNGNTFPMVLEKLLHVIAVIVPYVRTVDDCTVLRQHALLVDQACREGVAEDAAQEKVVQQFQQTMDAINGRAEQLLMKHKQSQ